MSLLTTYSSYLGVLPLDPPNINVQVFPVPFDKYITFHAGDGKIQAKHYDFWQEAIGLMKAALHHFGIKIIQIGGPEDSPISTCDAHYLTLSRAQSAYIQKGAMLHIGIDSAPIHIASAFSKKIVAVYSHIYKEQSPCNWSKPEDVIYLEPDRGENHPPFSAVEEPKMVNSIKPEQICRAVFKLLNLPAEINFETKFVGPLYNLSCVEIIPDFYGESAELKNVSPHLRMDLNFDEQCVHAWAQNQTIKIVSDKPVSLELLRADKKNIQQLTLLIDDIDSFSLEYVKKAKGLIPNLMLVGTNGETISNVREKFFDYIVERMPPPSRSKYESYIGSKFWTKKLVFSKAQQFASIAHWEKQIPFDKENIVVDSDETSREVDHFFIFN